MTESGKTAYGKTESREMKTLKSESIKTESEFGNPNKADSRKTQLDSLSSIRGS